MNVFWCLIFAATLLTANLVQASAGSNTTSVPRCFSEHSKKCVITTLAIVDPSEEVVLPSLSGKNTLQIKRGNLPAFSEKLADQLGAVEKIQLGPLELKEIFLKPELLEVTASGNQIELVNFKSADVGFKLQVLDLSMNHLKHLKGFEVLVNLRELHLEDNALESVDFQVFKSMTILEKLFLNRNQLITVEATERIDLSVLEYLSLSGNRLEKIDVTNWQLDSLTKWDVSSNRLVEIDGKLGEQFPSLQMISLAKNEWHCKWLEDTLNHFNESFVVVEDRDEDCQGISPANICCVPEQTFDPANDERLSDLKKLENEHKDLQANFESQYGRMKSDKESKLKNLGSRLKNLEELEIKNKELSSNLTADNSKKSQFEYFENAIQEIQSGQVKERQLWDKQQKDNDKAQRNLGFTIVELRRSLERDTKQIAELQVQFEHLRNHVRSKLEKRDRLMGS